jgi:hypothetical protein
MVAAPIFKREILQKEEAVSCGIVVVEILKGAKNERDFGSLYDSLMSLPHIPLDGAVTEKAANGDSCWTEKAGLYPPRTS